MPPLKIRDGRRMMARSNSNTPSTAMPNNRKGNSNSQTIGYRMSAETASGQQTIRRNSQRRKVTTVEPRIEFQDRVQKVLRARTDEVPSQAEFRGNTFTDSTSHRLPFSHFPSSTRTPLLLTFALLTTSNPPTQVLLQNYSTPSLHYSTTLLFLPRLHRPRIASAMMRAAEASIVGSFVE